VIDLDGMDDLLIKFVCYSRISRSKGTPQWLLCGPTCIFCFRDNLPKKLREVGQVVTQEFAPEDEIFSCVVCGKLPPK
jgi:wyosine [tRNA(Phe)-imidazoG37] synthetase (radical SAM superfamily)